MPGARWRIEDWKYSVAGGDTQLGYHEWKEDLRMNPNQPVEQRDLKAERVVGFQVDERNRVWVCVDGACVLRVVGAKEVEITDLRTPRTPRLILGGMTINDIIGVR